MIVCFLPHILSPHDPLHLHNIQGKNSFVVDFNYLEIIINFKNKEGKNLKIFKSLLSACLHLNILHSKCHHLSYSYVSSIITLSLIYMV